MSDIISKLTNLKILVVAGGSAGNQSAISNQNKLLAILSDVSDRIDLITCCDEDDGPIEFADEVIYLSTEKVPLFSYLIDQIRCSKAMAEFSKRRGYDMVFFAFGRDIHVLPVLFSKMLTGKTVLRTDSRPSVTMDYYKKRSQWFRKGVLKTLEWISYRSSDLILTESEYSIEENRLKGYPNVHVANLFVDLEIFKKSKEFDDRQFDFGYIGRYSAEKGIREFIEAVPMVQKELRDPCIYFAGNGPESYLVSNMIENNSNPDSFFRENWLKQNQLVDRLNDIKVLVVPSYKEGLPNIILESMACGTVVLSTDVGSIPAVLKDGETGFIIPDNCPHNIALNVIKVLNCGNLDLIIENARELIENEYSFSRGVYNMRKALETIM